MSTSPSSLTVIIPTIGRPSIRETMLSCVGADRVIVVSDGAHDAAPHELCQRFRRRYPQTEWVYRWLEPQRGAHGHAARNFVLDAFRLTGYVISIDDDDRFTEDAIAMLRSALAPAVEHCTHLPWLVFRMTFGEGSHCPGVTVWNEKRIRQGNVGTPMIVWPATAAARWGTSSIDLVGRDLGEGYFGDLDMAVALEAELGPPVWCDPIIATIRPRVVEAVA